MSHVNIAYKSAQKPYYKRNPCETQPVLRFLLLRKELNGPVHEVDGAFLLGTVKLA